MDSLWNFRATKIVCFQGRDALTLIVGHRKRASAKLVISKEAPCYRISLYTIINNFILFLFLSFAILDSVNKKKCISNYFCQYLKSPIIMNVDSSSAQNIFIYPHLLQRQMTEVQIWRQLLKTTTQGHEEHLGGKSRTVSRCQHGIIEVESGWLNNNTVLRLLEITARTWGDMAPGDPSYSCFG